MGKRLLVIDDEVAFLIALRKLLAEPEIEVDTAETMEDSMGLLEHNVYDAVIADIRLTGVQHKEGILILDHVKKMHNDTKVIMMTGFGNPEVMQEAYSLGADFYFEKPVSVSVLKGALQKLGIMQ
ncbi:MAG: response regulator [Thermodesulfovibrionales bacterium]|nr:response regulator [Thermodesulfovibrionales bacterium]